MGTRFNALMTIQVPLKQTEVPRRRKWKSAKKGYVLSDSDSDEEDSAIAFSNLFGSKSCSLSDSDRDEDGQWQKNVLKSIEYGAPSKKKCNKSFWADSSSDEEEEGGNGFDYCDEEDDKDDCCMEAEAESLSRSGKNRKTRTAHKGTSNAARVSKGSFVDAWSGLTTKDPKRHLSERITVTIVLYYVCSGGVPTPRDVRAAVDDLEDMYCSLESGRLADSQFDFMKSELTFGNMQDIHTKLVTQPPPKKMEAVANGDVFPTI